MKKKLFSMVLVGMLCVLTSFSFAVEEEKGSKMLEIQNAVQQVNAEYGTDFQYIGDGKENISKEEYVEDITQLAQREKKLLAYIEYRKNNPKPDVVRSDIVTYSDWATRTETKNAGHEMLQIRCTYRERYTPKRAVQYSSSQALVKSYYNNLGYWYDCGSPSAYTIDSGRTLAVKYTGTIKKGYVVGSATAYAEF